MRYIPILLVFCFCSNISGQEQTIGLFQNEKESYNGYTLFSSSKITYLIDNCGFQVNTWESEFRPGLGVYLLENGDLFRCGRLAGSFNGGGVGGHYEQYDWDGNLIWSFDIADEQKHGHHDVAVLPNGNFLALAWTKLTGAEAVSLGRLYDEEVWIEKIFEIEKVGNNEGNIVWEWSMGDHLIQDEFPELPNYGVVSDNPQRMNFNHVPPEEGVKKDWAHFNAIDYNEELDQIAISSRSFSEVWIIDHSTTSEEAASEKGGNSGKGGGILYRYGNPQVYNRGDNDDQVFFNQHNVEWVDAGSHIGDMTVFNNRAFPGQSNIIRWTPPIIEGQYSLEEDAAFGPTAASWVYTNEDFFSGRISGAQILPNNNVLICEGDPGVFFEVTEEGEKVWEYLNPINNINGPVAQGEVPVISSTFRILRYGVNYSAFNDRDLSPGSVIELDPLPSTCVIHTKTSTTDKDIPSMRLINSLASTSLNMYISKTTDYTIYDIMGQSLMSGSLDEWSTSIDVSHLTKGSYILSTLSDKKRESFMFIKL